MGHYSFECTNKQKRLFGLNCTRDWQDGFAFSQAYQSSQGFARFFWHYTSEGRIKNVSALVEKETSARRIIQADLSLRGEWTQGPLHLSPDFEEIAHFHPNLQDQPTVRQISLFLSYGENIGADFCYGVRNNVLHPKRSQHYMEAEAQKFIETKREVIERIGHWHAIVQAYDERRRQAIINYVSWVHERLKENKRTCYPQ